MRLLFSLINHRFSECMGRRMWVQTGIDAPKVNDCSSCHVLVLWLANWLGDDGMKSDVCLSANSHKLCILLANGEKIYNGKCERTLAGWSPQRLKPSLRSTANAQRMKKVELLH
jgi:hypothetical protein